MCLFNAGASFYYLGVKKRIFHRLSYLHPFVVIDLVVASVLMSMGMMMLSPMMISMPFKLMLFVLSRWLDSNYGISDRQLCDQLGESDGCCTGY